MDESPLRPTIGINEARDVTGYSVRHIKRLVDSGRLVGGRPDWDGSHRRVDAEDAHLLRQQRDPATTAEQRDAIRAQRQRLRADLGLPTDVDLDSDPAG